ncbi:MAG TPA: hypothetical protein VNX68_10410 [Nitrosopumilaceae archaeon]|jgi:hypothetical protein|nr:hypothetical protein [Nitrosopumilaceae archaeon]
MANKNLPIRKYKVLVCRTVHQHLEIEVEAHDATEAKEKALDEAGEHEFPGEKDAEYTEQGVTRLGVPFLQYNERHEQILITCTGKDLRGVVLSEKSNRTSIHNFCDLINKVEPSLQQIKNELTSNLGITKEDCEAILKQLTEMFPEGIE